MLYLDDYRQPQDSYKYTGREIYLNPNWKVVKNYDEFVDHILTYGLPSIISFDHDLAEIHYNNNVVIDYSSYEEKTGYDCAKWLVDYCLDNDCYPPKTMYCHSMNPVGAKNINELLNNFLYSIVRKHEEEFKKNKNG